MSGSGEQTRFWRDLGTVPNLLSLSRIVLVLVAVVVFVEGYQDWGLMIGIVGGLTDYLDGYIARKTDTSTELGEVIDRLGDLFLEVLAFMLMVTLGITTVYIFAIYLFREMVVLSARQYASRHGGNLKSGIFGKVKTNFLGYSFALLLIHHAIGNGFFAVGIFQNQDVIKGMEILGYIGLYGGLVASYISGLQYMRGFVEVYNNRSPGAT